MAMHNPSHPGEFIIQVYLDPNNLSGRELARKPGVAASTLNRILTGTSHISPDMALRLSKALSRSPENWLAMQSNHNLWQAKQHVKLGGETHALDGTFRINAIASALDYLRYNSYPITRWSILSSTP